jgi:hypothetical protein
VSQDSKENTLSMGCQHFGINYNFHLNDNININDKIGMGILPPKTYTEDNILTTYAQV